MKFAFKSSRTAVVGGLFLLVVLVVAYALWLILNVRSDMLAMQKQASKMKTSLVKEDAETASKALARFSQAAEDAHSKTESVGWKALSALPFVGKNFDAVATVADVSVDVAANAVAPAVDQIKGSAARQLTPHDGRVDLPAVERIQGVLARIDQSLGRAQSRVDRMKTDGLFGFMRKPLASLRSDLSDAHRGVDAAYKASQLMPSMLGGAGTRHYLLMFANNAEVRATGGLPGAWAVVTATDGKISMTTQGAGSEIRRFPKAVLQQSAAERALYQDKIATYFSDTNFTPEFPRTAELVRQMWRQRFGMDLNGVISVDAVSLGGFLKATGPVTVKGVKLTAKNAVDELLNGVYLRYPNANKLQDEFFKAAAETIFNKMMSVKSPTALAKALSQAVDQGRVYVHSFDPTEQRILGNSAITSLVSFTPSASPQLGVYLNDATGSKMSYYLRTDATATATGCSSGRQTLKGSAVFTMVPPSTPLNRYITGGGVYGTPAGEQTVVVHIYGPIGGTAGNWRFDGAAVSADVVMDRGRPVATIAVQLGPTAGMTHRVEWTSTSGVDQTADAELRVTPGMTARPAVQQIASACH